MVYYNWRYYNTLKGRWICKDLEFCHNSYDYVNNKAIHLNDKLGLLISQNQQSLDTETDDSQALVIRIGGFFLTRGGN